MANAWFRMYSEFATDAKVQMMTECDQRRFIMLLCLKCTITVNPTDDEISFQLRIELAEWQKTKQVFISKNLIDEGNNILSWDKRQFVTGDANPEAVANRSNYVYFVVDTVANRSNSSFSVVKIGISKNPWARLKEFQTGNANKLELVAKFRSDIVSDAEIHEILGKFRVAGEWFHLPNPIAKFVISHAKNKDSNYETLRSEIVVMLRSDTTSLATVATITTTDTDTDTDTEYKELKTKAQKIPSELSAMFANVDKQVEEDFRKIRKDKKLAITLTAMRKAEIEASKAGLTFAEMVKVCAENGWGGFKAQWYINSKMEERTVASVASGASPKVGYESDKDRSRREKLEQITGVRKNEQQLIDIN